MKGVQVAFLGNSSILSLSGYTLDDEEVIYDTLLDDLYNNPRWYLDNLDYFVEFRLRWGNYRAKRAILPYKFVRKPKHL